MVLEIYDSLTTKRSLFLEVEQRISHPFFPWKNRTLDKDLGTPLQFANKRTR